MTSNRGRRWHHHLVDVGLRNRSLPDLMHAS
jgi:hypothetical protein